MAQARWFRQWAWTQGPAAVEWEELNARRAARLEPALLSSPASPPAAKTLLAPSLMSASPFHRLAPRSKDPRFDETAAQESRREQELAEALLAAVWRQDEAALRKALAAGAKPMVCGPQSETPLHIAIETRFEAGVSLLLDVVDPLARNGGGRTAVHEAVRIQRADWAQAAWARWPQEPSIQRGAFEKGSLAHAALLRGDIECIDWAIGVASKIDALHVKDEGKLTALMCAAALDDGASVKKLIAAEREEGRADAIREARLLEHCVSALHMAINDGQEIAAEAILSACPQAAATPLQIAEPACLSPGLCALEFAAKKALAFGPTHAEYGRLADRLALVGDQELAARLREEHGAEFLPRWSARQEAKAVRAAIDEAASASALARGQARGAAADQERQIRRPKAL
jgi:hypothetical protein